MEGLIMATLGKTIIISIGGTPVAAVKSHEVNTQADLIEKASDSQQDYKEFVPGRKEWGINVNYLLTNVADIEKVLAVGTVVTCSSGSGSSAVTGQAIVMQCKQTYTYGNIAVGSFQLKGNGPLTAASE